MPDSSRLQAERVVAGRYRLLRPIARGGMAEVWEAQDETLGRPVAVKVLHPHLAIDESFLERFRREAVSAARLAHPNVVATYDTGIDDGLAYIVMELVIGRTLRQAISEHGALSPSRATAIAARVADALDYAHQAGVVHRDVKPANILICPDGRVKVADFGIAKAAAALDGVEGEGGAGAGEPKLLDELTRSGAIVGTAKYLSPEQINGEPIDGRADVYALGVVLYEMLCGRPPFDGETDVAVAVQHVSATPLSPRQVRAGIPRSLDSVVLRALSKSPDNRYRSARELHSALLSVDVGPDDAVPIVVREVTPPGGTPPTFVQSESRSLVPVAVIVALAVAVGIIGVLFASSEPGKRLLNRNGDGAQTAPVTIRQALAFDPPPGSGQEHDNELSFLFDGDNGTSWETETYENASFGGLKPGVGFVLELDGAQELSSLELSTLTPGWDVEVCLADEVLATRAEWGGAVAEREGVSRDASFDLNGERAGAVLVWITSLGEANRSVRVSEVRVGRVWVMQAGAGADSDEAQLVTAARTGEPVALETLLERHYDRVYALCRRLTGDDHDADDACQESLIAIVRGLKNFDGRSSFGTWAYRVATNACLDELRRRRRRPEPGLPEGRAEPVSVGVTDEQVAQRIDIDVALAQLPTEFRAAVVLRDLCRLSYDEIAEVLDVPPGTVRSRISRGRAALLPLLAPVPDGTPAGAGNHPPVPERPNPDR